MIRIASGSSPGTNKTSLIRQWRPKPTLRAVSLVGRHYANRQTQRRLRNTEQSKRSSRLGLEHSFGIPQFARFVNIHISEGVFEGPTTDSLPDRKEQSSALCPVATDFRRTRRDLCRRLQKPYRDKRLWCFLSRIHRSRRYPPCALPYLRLPDHSELRS